MDKFIYIKENCISKYVCKEIIDKFENLEADTYEGCTAGGYNPHVKKTIDFNLPIPGLKVYNTELYNDWCGISKLLIGEIEKHIGIYIKNINEWINENDDKLYSVFPHHELNIESLLFHKYFANQGSFEYHSDNAIKYKEGLHRTVTYLFYLNDIDVGGETEIMKTIKIKPEAGKLLLFPACWTYPHKGCMPISNNKYIITGWIYIK